MTVQDLIDELEALPKSAKSAQVLYRHVEEYIDDDIVQSVTYERGIVLLNEENGDEAES